MWHRMEKGKVRSPLSDLYRMVFFILVCFQEHLGRMRVFGFDSDMGDGFRPFPVCRFLTFPGSSCKTVAFVVRYGDGFREVRKEEG